jgi:hypothetical protein
MLIKFGNVRHGANCSLCGCQAKLQRGEQGNPKPRTGHVSYPRVWSRNVPRRLARLTSPPLLVVARRSRSMLKVQSKLLRRIWMGVTQRHRRRWPNQRFTERGELSPMLCHIGRASQHVATSPRPYINILASWEPNSVLNSTNTE